jgi:hypothetical protein
VPDNNLPSYVKIEYTTRVPDSARAGGRTGQPSPWLQFLKDMPAPSPVKPAKKNPDGSPVMNIAWFFIPADQPADTVQGEEREKAVKANANKLVNRFTSIARRIRKTNGDTHNYTFRKVRDPNAEEGQGEWGLQVFRIEAEAQ